MSTPPITREIGLAERTLQALLERQLAPSALSFAEWAALILLANNPGSTTESLVDQLVAGKIMTRIRADELLTALTQSGLITTGSDDRQLSMTAKGQETFDLARARVGEATAALLADLAPPDLEATRRTLTEITRRANTYLSG